MAEITISTDDLKDPAIDDILNLQKSLQPQRGNEKQEDVKTPFYFNPIFYYGLAGLTAGFLSWFVSERYIDESSTTNVGWLADFLMFSIVAASIGLALGAIYGIANRNWTQSLICALIGAGVGCVATIVTTFIAEILFRIGGQIAVSMIESRLHDLKPGEFPFKGMSFFIFMCTRGIAWSVVSMGAGLGLGIALKSKKLILNGLVGAMIGGLIGGLCFDPISRFVTFGEHSAGLSRAVGISLVGLFVGGFIGLFENITKESWFLMLKGPLAGKQFIIFKNPMLIGSSPKSDIYLFKDADIAPKHATVTKTGNKYLLQDEGSDKGTYVNGKRVDKYILQPQDTISIGEAVLRYSEKSKS